MTSAHPKLFLSALLLNIGLLNAQSVKKNNLNQTITNEVTMAATQKNKEVVRNIYEQAFNKRNLQLLQNYISDDYIGIKGTKGAAGFQEPAAALIKAFPDAQWHLVSLIGEGDNVFVKWKFEGTQTGTFQNIEATGKKVSSDGMAVLELKDGKVISSQVHTDRLGFLQQLNVLPEDLTSLQRKPVATKDQIRFIDTFTIPGNVSEEFMQRVKINRDFIKKLPGFVEDAAFQRKDENGNVIFMTIAVWENEQAVQHAKNEVQAEYKREGFNPAEFLKKLNITMDRGIFKEVP
ncbi:MAG TPA: ester cyclase [Cyclobacteriaceae bacterium]|jgi:predicted ester cyclase/heme-degrading monooxygenase HmoA|nr:ester cyclase [Cyclobacteriaceae bacterium]